MNLSNHFFFFNFRLEPQSIHSPQSDFLLLGTSGVGYSFLHAIHLSSHSHNLLIPLVVIELQLIPAFSARFCNL